MQFKIDRKDFVDVLTKLNSVLSSRAMIPALSCALITKKDDTHISLRSTDLEVYVTCTADAKEIEEESPCLLPVVLLLKALKSSKDKEVCVTCSDFRSMHTVMCDSSSWQFSSLDTQDYPDDHEQLGDAVYFTLEDSRSFFTNLSLVNDFTSKESKGRTLDCVNFVMKDRVLILRATNAYRAARWTCLTESLQAEHPGTNIRQNAVNGLCGIFKGTKCPVDVALGNTFAVFADKSTSVVIKTAATEYPDTVNRMFRAILMDEIETIKINVEEFLSAMDATEVYSSGLNLHTTYMDITGSDLILSTISSKGECAEAMIPIKALSYDMKKTMDGTFLRSCVKPFSKEVVMYVKAGHPAVTFMKDNFTTAFMEIRKV